MTIRLFQHIIFWFVFVLIYAVAKILFASPSDLDYPPILRFVRYLFVEIAFLPWKALPFYYLFYWLIPKYFLRGKYLKILFLFSLCLLVSLLGYRSMISPVSNILYGTTPAFWVYSPKRIFFSLTDILPGIALAAAAKLFKGRLTTIQRMEQLQREKQAVELNFLKAQFQPHFLFNTLNNLYGLARKNAVQTAPSIMKLSGLMRYILQECKEHTIPVYKEIKVIEDYISLEKLRYSDRLKINFLQEIDNDKIEIAPLILLSFVENSFKHGAGESRFDIFIDIKLRMKNQVLDFKIKNPVSSYQNTIATGTGIYNVSRQLELIYGSDHELNISSNDGYFKVHLIIKIKP